MSAFVDMDISKARTTKVTSVERVESGLHKTRHDRACSSFLGQLQSRGVGGCIGVSLWR